MFPPFVSVSVAQKVMAQKHAHEMMNRFNQMMIVDYQLPVFSILPFFLL